MYRTIETFQAEIDYRANKARDEIGRSRRVRRSFGRKPLQSSDSAR
jgi:hypothetical protein